MTTDLGPFKHVLACIAPSPHAREVAVEAGRLAAACGSKLTFVHAGREGDEVRRIVADALPGVEAEVVEREGAPERVILSEAARQGADLIFAGALQSDPLLRGIVGSLARRLARHAERSVYLSIHQFPPDRLVRTLVVGIDVDERSARLMRDMAAFARKANVLALHVVYEFDPHAPGATGPGDEREQHERLRAASERFRVADFLGTINLEGLPVRVTCLSGRDYVETMRFAEEQKADLLAVAAPPRRLGLLDRFFGHPTDTILQRFPCSILLHRSRREPIAEGEGGE
ncbi:MAG: universal stress protein [Leptolyngbya sp. PLA2]|nr:universal stress protein [Leptolyngbya sp.]MCE7971456.1 universal stress protein [Leptolyngbya sp. PL-A2]MCQ3940671.1 hypothetical protein [cyanobacterium CYA1]MCZ7632334.1 universal stress protein [Phycisphaerales bacterium]MDL1903641.1 universal stress protein [Synechococcales cyanobacterium CNB]GIK18391.1 MAG: hypothetical protein BroJett004_05550 [Planctomycetota bacterium]